MLISISTQILNKVSKRSRITGSQTTDNLTTTNIINGAIKIGEGPSHIATLI